MSDKQSEMKVKETRILIEWAILLEIAISINSMIRSQIFMTDFSYTVVLPVNLLAQILDLHLQTNTNKIAKTLFFLIIQSIKVLDLLYKLDIINTNQNSYI